MLHILEQLNLQNNTIDTGLINATLQGDRNAFRKLYVRYAKHHMLVCIRYMKTKHDAEDVLQEAYIKIFRDLSKFDASKGTYNAWSGRVVINSCLQQLRKNKAGIDIMNIENLERVSGESPAAIQVLNLKDLTKIITGLPDGYRTVFNMYVIDGYSHKEIAATFNISESTSKSQLMRAKKTLRTYLTEQQIDSISLYA